MLSPVVVFNPIAGLQTYVVAPLIIKFTESPGHKPGLPGVIDKVGVGVTFIVVFKVSLQPKVLVPITVYVVVVGGVATTLALVDELRLAEGLHT
jgi:hypothetical protein